MKRRHPKTGCLFAIPFVTLVMVGIAGTYDPMNPLPEWIYRTIQIYVVYLVLSWLDHQIAKRRAR